MYPDKDFKWDFDETLKRMSEKIQDGLKQVNEALDFLEQDPPFLTEGDIESLYDILKEAKKVLSDE